MNAKELVEREVYYCVSGLVSALAGGYGDGFSGRQRRDQVRALADLCEQAFELSASVADWEEAAVQAGWEGPLQNKFGVTYYRDTRDGRTCTVGSWESLCRDHDIDPLDREVFEHWIVSDWLARKLEAKGEKVDHDFAGGLTVWARCTTGQAIAMDGVIVEICRELEAV